LPGFVIRLLVSALGLWAAAALVPGIQIHGVRTLLVAALLLGLVNAIVRPVLVVLTFPITVLSLGLFLLVINAAMLGLVAALLPGFSVLGFMSAFSGAIIVAVTGWFASWNVGSSGRRQALRAGRHRR
jgi:putative membrane protein